MYKRDIQGFRDSVRNLESKIKTLQTKQKSRRFQNKASEIQVDIDKIKEQIEDLRKSYESNTKGYQNKIKKQDRRDARAAAGGRLSRTSKDKSFIPWMPVKIESGRVVDVVDEITSSGHTGEYTASWVDKLPAVKIVKNKTTAHAYYGMRSNATTFTPRVVNGGNASVANKFNLSLNKSKIIHHSKFTGIGVSELNTLMSKNIDSAGFYLDTKLIMDRYTADQAKWVNNTQNHYVMKPFSAEFATLLDMWKRSRDDKQVIIAEMNEQLESSMPYYFNNAGVYTGDRPLVLYCLYNQIPYIWERQTRDAVTYYINKFISRADLKNILLATNDKTLRFFADNINNPAEFLNMLKILDSFHDFVGSRSLTTKEDLQRYINLIYKDKYTQFVETIVSGLGVEGQIRTIENMIGKLVMETSKSVTKRAGDERLYELLKNTDLLDYCWIYDAGTQIPMPILQKIASTTQRTTNSFEGPLARLQASDYNVQPTNYFTRGRNMFM